MLSTLQTYFENEKYKVYPHPVPQIEDREPIKILISGAFCKSAESLAYGIIKGSVFGADQPVTLVLFDIPGERFSFVSALACQLTISGFGLVKDVIPTHNPNEAFDNIDVAVFLNPEQSEEPEKYNLNYYFHLYKNLGYKLNQLAKKTVKVVVAGEKRAECSMIISHYAETIPVKNITGLSRHIAARVYNDIVNNLKPNFKNVYGIHVWGINRADTACAATDEMKDGYIPQKKLFRKIGHQIVHMYTEVQDRIPERKKLTEGILNLKWIKYETSKEVDLNKLDCNNQWVGTAICKHLKDWWNGTEQPVSMIVCSDGSYDIPVGLFASFPVKIDQNKKWSIVKEIEVDPHTAADIKEDIKYLNFIKTQITIYGCREDVRKLIEEKLKPNEQLIEFLNTY